MKKYFIMALAAILPLAFVSCGSDDDSPSPSPAKTTTLEKLDTSKSLMLTGIAKGSVTPSELSKKVPTDADFDPEGLATFHNSDLETPDNKDRVWYLDGATAKVRTALRLDSSDPWDFGWIVGKYTIEGNNYKVPGYGIINIIGGGTKLKFTFDDKTTNELEAKVESYSKYTSEHAGWACRSWKVTKSAIVINENGAQKFRGEWDGCNLADIANNIKKTIGDFDDSELQALGKLEKITFKPYGGVKFFFEGATKTVKNAKWSLASDDTFEWHLDGTAGNSIINADGKGNIKWDGNDATITMSIKANGGKYTGNALFKVTPYNK